MKSILVLLKTLGLGGAETLVLNSIPHWDRKAFDYRLGWFGGPDTLRIEFEQAGVLPVRFSPSGWANDPSVVPILATYLRREKIDLVHAHLPAPALAAGLAGKLTGTKVIATSHCEPDGMRPLTARLARLTWPLADAVIAVGDGVARTVQGARRTEVIENGVELPPRSVRAAMIADIPAESPLVLVIGSLAEVKRPLETLKVFEPVARSIPLAHFAFAGTGPLAPDLETARDRSPYRERIHLLGQRRDIQELVKRSAVICLLSRNEGLPMSLLEGAAGGRPLVGPASSSAAGTLIENGVTGYAVGSDDEAALRLKKLLTDEKLRQQMGAAARQRVETRFSISVHVRRTENLYREVLG